jgi:predicted nucleic acid-binding Zn ribbon protein
MINFDFPRPRSRWAERRKVKLTCKACQKPFEATRPDAVSCSDKCRQQKRRDRKRAEKEAKKLKRKK